VFFKVPLQAMLTKRELYVDKSLEQKKSLYYPRFKIINTSKTRRQKELLKPPLSRFRSCWKYGLRKNE
jgi:hypothetical protein